MPANTIGERFRVTVIGESHGPLIGAIIDGVPAGLPISEGDIQPMLDLRRPHGELYSTGREEPDSVRIASGLYRGMTTGGPLTLLIENRDVDSRPYEGPPIPRPGHADYTAWIKYGGRNDPRGGGRFSGRMTAAFVASGAVALKLLRRIGVEVLAYTVEIGGVRAHADLSVEEKRRRYEDPLRCPDHEASKSMEEKIMKARRDGDSVGGIVECLVVDVPAGLGEPIIDTLDGDLAKAMFAIPAVKGIEFGAGFKAARLRGSENNDQFTVEDGKVVTLTNNAGGILGGISNGMPIAFRVAFKPVSSIARKQRSVRLDTMEEVELIVKGRHDICIVPRAVPIVESMTAIVIVDHVLRAGIIAQNLDGYERPG